MQGDFSMLSRHLIATAVAFTLSLCANQALAQEVTDQWDGLVNPSTCGAPDTDGPTLSNSDFRWHQPLDEIQQRAQRLYESDKRLAERAYINNDGEVVLPRRVFSGPAQEVRLQPHFVLSVRRHVEQALLLGYVDEIIFSDMGHSHFFIPQKFYDEVIAPIPVSESHRRYELMLANKDLKFLYHTAEQLKMLDDDYNLVDDRHVQWRFFTRNLVGDNKAQGHLELIHQENHSHNTARSYREGYRYWGAGFYISANKSGCFPFKHQGKIYYFDLNLSGIHI